MNNLQKRLLEILVWFHAFCEREHLRYYAVGGTFLGAVRHQGFIPWDDDIDVGMPRTDYERCQAIFAESNWEMGKYRLETPASPAKEFCYTLTKLYDMTTTLIERGRRNITRGIFLDVIPLDGAGNDLKEAKSNFRKIDFLNMFLATRICAIRKQRKLYKNLAIIAARTIPSCLLDEKEMAMNVDALCRRRDYDSCKYVGDLRSGYREREIMPREVYGTPTMYSFEGHEIYGPENAEEYLTRLYGDWRKLPPIEERGVQHDYLKLDLEKSWLDTKG